VTSAEAATYAYPLCPKGFNRQCKLPYGLTVPHIQSAMEDFLDFIRFVDLQLSTRQISPLESMLMPANFSSMVGEFMVSGISSRSPTLTKNRYHNGHPDLIPAGKYPDDAAQHAPEGIEVKASRYLSGWQGHNPENTWLLVFVFQAARPTDDLKGISFVPFGFVKVVGARLKKSDWLFAGRSGASRRTITASVTRSGWEKMESNWIYRDLSLLSTSS